MRTWCTEGPEFARGLCSHSTPTIVREWPSCWKYSGGLSARGAQSTQGLGFDTLNLNVSGVEGC